MGKNLIIAIDGPASSGKSTTAKLLAQKLKYIYIDTGAMYRACALCSLKNNIDMRNLLALTNMMETIEIKIEYSASGNRVFLFEEDITERIREEDISRLSSEIAVIGIVREKMVDLQRKLGKQGGVIMDGRDIGTVVFPYADLKFFMIASVKVRAYRRWLELKNRGIDTKLAKVEEEISWRDKNDKNRKISPLKKANDAVLIDTDNLTINEQVKKILEYVEKN